MRVNNENMLLVDGVAVNGSLATSKNFKPVWLGHICNFSIQLTFTGTPAGNFKLQASNDPGQPNAASEVQQSASVTHWTDVANSSTTVSAAGDVMYDYQNAGFTWVRVSWTATGAGTTPVLTTGRVNVKGS